MLLTIGYPGMGRNSNHAKINLHKFCWPNLSDIVLS